jgi:hypothetical protein
MRTVSSDNYPGRPRGHGGPGIALARTVQARALRRIPPCVTPVFPRPMPAQNRILHRAVLTVLRRPEDFFVVGAHTRPCPKTSSGRARRAIKKPHHLSPSRVGMRFA